MKKAILMLAVLLVFLSGCASTYQPIYATVTTVSPNYVTELVAVNRVQCNYVDVPVYLNTTQYSSNGNIYRDLVVQYQNQQQCVNVLVFERQFVQNGYTVTYQYGPVHSAFVTNREYRVGSTIAIDQKITTATVY